MRLSKAAKGEALCPICALDGLISPLEMAVNSLAITCGTHIFNTVELSNMAIAYEVEAKNR